MPESKSLILDHKNIEQKINRIAYQIYETHYDQKKIIIAGIAESGFILAKLISMKLKKISPLDVVMCELKINKKNPLQSEINLNIEPKDFKNETIIVVDDVSNSGKTMMYVIKPFLEVPIKKLSIAVLIKRSHKRFPLNADYVGLSLTTTLKEHIEVSLEKGNYAAYLS